MTPLERKRKLEDLYGTQSAFCRKYGLDAGLVSGVLGDTRKNKRVQELIASEFQMTLEEVFPPREAMRAA